MSEMPEIDPDKINFDEFHPLDHRVWSCKGYPGGRRRHLIYRWQYQWSLTLWRLFWCRLGRHYETTVTRRDQARMRIEERSECFYCGRITPEGKSHHGTDLE